MNEARSPRRWPKRLALAAIGFLLLAQAVPYGRDHTNPPVTGEPDWDSPRTRELFMRTCGDCHSHETRWVWYTHVAPASWLVQRDVDEAREHFNVSTWNLGPGDADEAVEEFEEGEMPLWFYLPLHSEARLNDEDQLALIEGMRATFGEKGE